MLNKNRNLYIIVLAGVIIVIPLFIFAAQGPINIATVCGLIALIDRIKNWFISLLLVVAVIMILVSAFMFITAAGDQNKAATARTTLIYALLGIALVILAQVAVNIVNNIITGGTGVPAGGC